MNETNILHVSFVARHFFWDQYNEISFGSLSYMAKGRKEISILCLIKWHKSNEICLQGSVSSHLVRYKLLYHGVSLHIMPILQKKDSERIHTKTRILSTITTSFYIYLLMPILCIITCTESDIQSSFERLQKYLRPILRCDPRKRSEMVG